jgi:hypothetical protein
VEHTLESLVYLGPREGLLEEDWKLRSGEELLRLRIGDLAVGGGAFLLQVCCYLADRLVEAWESEGSRRKARGEGDDRLLARQEVARSCLYGVDRNPLAVEIARLSLWLLTRSREPLATFLTERIRCGDSLLSSPLATRHSPLSFDAIVGNPPFINAIDGSTSPAMKRRLRQAFPELCGTADLSYYFLARADQLTRSDGVVGLILPCGFLNARAAQDLRGRLLRQRPPALLYAPTDSGLFGEANVFVVLVVLGAGGACRGGRELPFRDLTVWSGNWWQALESIDARFPFATTHHSPLTTHHSLGDQFLIQGSMTTGMAYDALPHLVDDGARSGARLITTGLIDPFMCKWGQQPCRYLKRVFRHPVLPWTAALPGALAQRLAQVRRPKVLVAGVAGPGNRLEAFVDHQGTCCGAVSTFTILHPEDDLAVLERLCRHLHSDGVTRRIVPQLGASALGAGLLTITKAFLRGLPLPAEHEVW